MEIKDNTLPQAHAPAATAPAPIVKPAAATAETPVIPVAPPLSNPAPSTPVPIALPAAVRVAPRTNNQIKASALADGIAAKAKWKTLVVEAGKLWTKIPTEELATVDGNFQKLAGLVQMRHRLSRQESDQQVKGFFDRHYPAATITVPGR